MRHVRGIAIAITALVWMAAPAHSAEPSAMPSPADVANLFPPEDGGCVMFSNGVCVCSEMVASVDQLTCSRTAEPGVYACSYNLIWQDSRNMGGRQIDQRMDRMGKDSNGKWSVLGELAPPKTL